MLNKEEKALLQRVLDASPNPAAQSYNTMEGEDKAALERLVHLELLAKRGWNPVQYQITDKGRHYSRDVKEQVVAKRKELFAKGFFFVLGAATTEILHLLIPAMLVWLQHTSG